MSPDGKHVVRDCGYGSTLKGYGLVLQDVSTGQRRTILPSPSWPHQLTARWSPDGRQIAVAVASTRVVVIDVDDLEVHDVTTGPVEGNVNGITWSPDGQTLLTEDCTTIDMATGTVTARPDLCPPLPDGWSSYSRMSRWAPNGLIYITFEISFPGSLASTRTLHVVDPATGASEILLSQSGYMGRVQFLPGGRLLVNRDENTALVLDGDGSHPHTLAAPFGMSFVAARPL
ncbi:MAG: hypothetical protein Q8K58_10820 [Acidimicrobiales bacterium]|nr:hypothetical protein [Acidimicrobiales bacterium]